MGPGLKENKIKVRSSKITLQKRAGDERGAAGEGSTLNIPHPHSAPLQENNISKEIGKKNLDHYLSTALT